MSLLFFPSLEGHASLDTMCVIDIIRHSQDQLFTTVETFSFSIGPLDL
jgi:hypothetical protein